MVTRDAYKVYTMGTALIFLGRAITSIIGKGDKFVKKNSPAAIRLDLPPEWW
jgi:hypothetical protein